MSTDESIAGNAADSPSPNAQSFARREKLLQAIRFRSVGLCVSLALLALAHGLQFGPDSLVGETGKDDQIVFKIWKGCLCLGTGGSLGAHPKLVRPIGGGGKENGLDLLHKFITVGLEILATL